MVGHWNYRTMAGPPEPKPDIREDYNALDGELSKRLNLEDWLSDALSYAICNDDKEYLWSQVLKHVNPIIDDINKELYGEDL
jgi:hypothetical protein